MQIQTRRYVRKSRVVSERIFMGSLIVIVASLTVEAHVALADPVAECQAVTTSQVETGQCLRDTLGAAESVMDLALERAQAEADSVDQVTGRPGARQALDQSQTA